MPKIKRRNSIRFKYTLVMVVLVTMIIFTSSVVGFMEFKSKFETQYIEQAYTISRLISSNIDPKNISSYLNEGRYTILDILKNSLNTMWTDMDINYIALSNADFTLSNYIYIKNGVKVPEFTAEEDWLLQTDFDQGYYVVKNGASDLDVILPVVNQDGEIGAFVRTQINLDNMYIDIISFATKIITGSAIIAGFIMVLFLRYIRQYIVEPIITVSRAVNIFANSHYEIMPELKPLNTHDEVDYLIDSISKMTSDIEEYIKNIEENINEKEKMNAELRIAHHIQKSLLPKELPKTNEFDLYAFMNSAEKVGGDFYDFFYVTPTQLVFLVGDVSGKGVPAALFMITAKEGLKTKTMDGHTPSRALEIVNNSLIDNNADRMFVTSWLGKVNLENGELTYVSAGHPPAMIKRKGEGFKPLMDNQNKFLATFEDIKFSQSTIQLEEGDIVFLYTDGLTEAEKNDDPFGDKRLQEALNRNIKIYDDLEDFVKSIRYEIRIYEKESTSKDDLTMLAFRFNGKKPNRINHIM